LSSTFVWHASDRSHVPLLSDGTASHAPSFAINHPLQSCNPSLLFVPAAPPPPGILPSLSLFHPLPKVAGRTSLPPRRHKLARIKLRRGNGTATSSPFCTQKNGSRTRSDQRQAHRLRRRLLPPVVPW
jgi:hypothetical protein